MAARIVDRPAKTGSHSSSGSRRVFAEQGYQSATIDAIADRAGIGKGTVYEYFRNKQELFFGVFDDYIASMAEFARQSMEVPSATAAEQIQQAIHSVLAMSAEGRDLFPLVFEFWSASASPERQARVATMFRETYAKFRELIATQIQKGQHNANSTARSTPPGSPPCWLAPWTGCFCRRGSIPRSMPSPSATSS